MTLQDALMQGAFDLLLLTEKAPRPTEELVAEMMAKVLREPIPEDVA